MKIQKNVIIAEFIDLILFMFTFVLMFVGMNSFYSMFFIALTIHIYLFFSWSKINRSWFNYFNILIILSFIYYFGQYLLLVLGFPLSYQYTIKNVYTPKHINYAASFLLLNMIVLHESYDNLPVFVPILFWVLFTRSYCLRLFHPSLQPIPYH